VDAHGVHIFDGADDDHVVFEVPHHLQLEFLPAHHGFFQHDLGNHAGLQALGGQILQVLQVVSDAAAGAPQGEAGADDDRVADGRGRDHGFVQGADNGAPGHPQADLGHGVPEQFPVFSFFDDLGVGADHLHPQPLQDTGFGYGDGAVETGLAAQGGEQRVGALPLDDLADHLRGDGLDVGAVGHLRVGHDGGGVGVDEDHLKALFPEGLAGLGAGIVEFAGLGDDDGPGADDEYFLDVGAFGHTSRFCSDFLGRGLRAAKGETPVPEANNILGLSPDHIPPINLTFLSYLLKDICRGPSGVGSGSGEDNRGH